jgi:hypothetical protein
MSPLPRHQNLSSTCTLPKPQVSTVVLAPKRLIPSLGVPDSPEEIVCEIKYIGPEDLFRFDILKDDLGTVESHDTLAQKYLAWLAW